MDDHFFQQLDKSPLTTDAAHVAPSPGDPQYCHHSNVIDESWENTFETVFCGHGAYKIWVQIDMLSVFAITKVAKNGFI